jgi:hypothetical protein
MAYSDHVHYFALAGSQLHRDTRIDDRRASDIDQHHLGMLVDDRLQLGFQDALGPNQVAPINGSTSTPESSGNNGVDNSSTVARSAHCSVVKR